jgi:hypothetical protein
VTFCISHFIWADRFAVVGDFNGQDQETFPMMQSALDPDWHITIAIDSGRRYRFFYRCDDDEWNSDNSADDYSIDCDGRVYGVVDTLRWPLPNVDSLALEALTYPAWSMLGAPYEQKLARSRSPVPFSVPAGVDHARLAGVATVGRVTVRA